MWIVLACVLPFVATAHGVEESSGKAGEFFIIGLLMLAGVWFAVGLSRVHSASTTGRSALLRRAALFGSGWAVIAASLVSPLHRLGGLSFTAHMIEHELLMLVAAPLMAWSRPLGIFLWALPQSTRHRLSAVSRGSWFSVSWNTLSSALVASLVQMAALWLWHAPAFFNRALLSEGWHAAQHLSLLFSALLFWWAIHKIALERKPGVAAFWLFFTSLQSGLLGALMSFAQGPWYARYVELGLAGTFGLTPLEDQQLAGLIMWIPGGAFHAVVALWYVHRWLTLPSRAIASFVGTTVLLASMLPRQTHADTVFVSDEELDRIVVVDGERMQQTAEIKVSARPRGVVLSADGKTLYVAVSNAHRIDIVDTGARKVIGHLPSGPDPEVIALDPAGKRIFVANEDDSLVSVVDIAAARIITEVRVGAEPEGMAVSPDGCFAVATSESASMAHLIKLCDVSQPALVANVLVDTRPRYAAFTADGRQVWISSEARGTVTVFETATQRRLGRIDFEHSDLPGDTLQAVGIQITRDGQRAFVALGRGNQVAEVNPHDFSVVRAFPAGSRVWNIALATDEHRLYAAAGLSAELTIIDLVGNRVAGTLHLGGKPWGVVATR